MITYCKFCLFPSTKPDLKFNKGICSACDHYFGRPKIDFEKRYKELLEIVEKFKNKSNSNWDCIIPSSGGKDSTYQAITMRNLGLNPLLVTATTCDLSEYGRRNIENLKEIGFDTIEVSPSKVVRRKLNKIGLVKLGDISWPEHLSIFTIPVRIAVQLNIPLLIWGENSQNEYGGPEEDSDNNQLTRRWLEEFGGLLGLRKTDLVGLEGITEKDLVVYDYPTDEQLKKTGITGLFLGHYIPWDGLRNVLVAQSHGFKTIEQNIETAFINYENLDNYHTGIHDYFKFLKFGFSRATDVANLFIRRERISRTEALDIVRRTDGLFPWTYLGKPIEKILEPIEISLDQFIDICDRFTNKKIFKTNSQGNLIKDKKGNLTKVNYDNQ